MAKRVYVVGFLLVLGLAVAHGLAVAQTADWAALIRAAKPAVVWILAETREGTSFGSGAIISPDGYILTAAHVIEGAIRIKVVVEETREFWASVVTADYKVDLAVLKISATGLTWFALGDSGKLAYEEPIRVLGYPRPGIGVGFIPASGYFLGLRTRPEGTYVQFEASPLDQGHSGGPLINSLGHIVGIVKSVVAVPALGVIHKIAVSTDTIRRVIPLNVLFALPTTPSPIRPPPPAGLSRFSVTDLTITPSPPFARGTTATIAAWVTHTAGPAETKSVWLLVDGHRVADALVTLVPGQRQQITFQHTFMSVGNYSVSICSPDGCAESTAVQVVVMFKCTGVHVQPRPPFEPGTEVTICAGFRNDGPLAETDRVWIVVNEKVVIGETYLTLGPGASQTVCFKYVFTSDGIFEVEVDTSQARCTAGVLVVSSRECLRTLAGHTYSVWSVAFSPDGKTLASGAEDDTIRLWDVATGKELRTFTGHTGWVYSVAFSPDGKTLASGSSDTTIKLWDVATGKLLRTLSGHTHYVESVAFSPDGKTLASGSKDETIKLWDVATGAVLRTLSGHTGSVQSVAFSPDGKTLASGSGDDTIKLWDVSRYTRR